MDQHIVSSVIAARNPHTEYIVHKLFEMGYQRRAGQYFVPRSVYMPELHHSSNKASSPDFIVNYKNKTIVQNQAISKPIKERFDKIDSKVIMPSTRPPRIVI